MLLLLAVASVVIAVVTTVTLRQFLDGRLDNDLRATSGLFQRSAGRPPLPPPDADGLPGSGNRRPRPPDSLLAQIDGGQVVSATVYTRDGETGRSHAEYAASPDCPWTVGRRARCSASWAATGCSRRTPRPGA